MLKTELEESDLVSQVTIKDSKGNSRTLDELELYDFGHLRKPPYCKQVKIFNNSSSMRVQFG